MHKEVYMILEVIMAIASIGLVSIFMVLLIDFISRKTKLNINYIIKETKFHEENVKALETKYESDMQNKELEISILKQDLNTNKKWYSEKILQYANTPSVETEVMNTVSHTMHNTMQETGTSIIPQEIVGLVFQDALHDYKTNEESLVKSSIDDFEYATKRYEIRCALPYVFIIRVMDMYDKDANMKFRDCFTWFMAYYNTPNAKRILRNRFLSAEEKLNQIIEEIDLLAVNADFSEFLLYVLKTYNYKHITNIYRNYTRCFNYRYATGDVIVSYANEYIKDLFLKYWEYEDSRYTVIFKEKADLLEGLSIQFDDIFIDYTYETLVMKYINKVKRSYK